MYAVPMKAANSIVVRSISKDLLAACQVVESALTVALAGFQVP